MRRDPWLPTMRRDPWLRDAPLAAFWRSDTAERPMATGSHGHRFPSSYSYSTLGRRKGMRTTRRRGKACACTQGSTGVAAGRIAALHADHIQANLDREGRKKSKQIQIGEEEEQGNPGRCRGPPPPAICRQPPRPVSCSPCRGREAATGGGIAVPCSPLAARCRCRRFDASGRVGRGCLPASGTREEAEETRRRERREENGGREEGGGGGRLGGGGEMGDDGEKKKREEAAEEKRVIWGFFIWGYFGPRHLLWAIVPSPGCFRF
uniref:Uncharacterized protein n=1 Tax=Oryza glumipatula TaxID=40148 RepID=A0A0D9YG32_9ORYZ